MLVLLVPGVGMGASPVAAAVDYPAEVCVTGAYVNELAVTGQYVAELAVDGIYPEC